MAQNQTLPSITQLTGEIPQSDPNRLSQNVDPRYSDIRDSGNWSSVSQSKHSSTVSNNPGLQLQTILNAEDSPSRGSIPPDTPHSARAQQQVSPPKADYQQMWFASGSQPNKMNSLPSVHQGFAEHPRQSLDAPSMLDSRRSSVDSRMNAGMGHLAISPSSPYDSQNASRVSLVSNLQQQRGIPDSRTNGSIPVSPLSARINRAVPGVGTAPVRRAPVINPNPRSVSGMPDPTAPAPTKGFAWAFPDREEAEDERRRSSSGDSSGERSVPSRKGSFATSLNSIYTTDSQLPPGQKRFGDGDVHTHHHQMQHRAITALQTDGQMAGGSGNYSRTPELRVSHKMAERKRRSEMKSLFDELNTILPNTPGGKSSKWEVLTKAIEHIKVLKYGDQQLRRDNESLRNQSEYARRLEEETKALRSELGTCWQHLQRVEPNNHHVFGSFTSSLVESSQSTGTHQTGHARLPPLPPAQMPSAGALFAGAQGGSAPMEGVQSYQSFH